MGDWRGVCNLPAAWCADRLKNIDETMMSD